MPFGFPSERAFSFTGIPSAVDGEWTDAVDLGNTNHGTGPTLYQADQFADVAATAANFPGFRTVKNEMHRSGLDDKSTHFLRF